MVTASVSEERWSARADARALVLVAIVVAGVVATRVRAWAVANSPILVDPSSVVVWRNLCVSAYVAVGVYTRWRRPQSPLGPLVGDGARATVSVARDEERPAFAIADDGVGMDMSAHGDGDGLVGVRDRIGAVGGELRIGSTPDVGTTVRGTVPLGDDVAREDAP